MRPASQTANGSQQGATTGRSWLLASSPDAAPQELSEGAPKVFR